MQNTCKLTCLVILIMAIAGIEYTYSDSIPEREKHCAVYDPENNQMVVLGGNRPGGQLRDIWSFDIKNQTWKKIETEEEPAKVFHRGVYDLANKRILIFGGNASAKPDALFILSDMFAFDIGKKTWDKIENKGAPEQFIHPLAIYEPENKQVFILAGDFQPKEIYVFDTKENNWNKIKTKGNIPARGSYSAVYNEAKKQIIIFAGNGHTGQFLSDTWTYDIANNKWEKIRVKEYPPARASHAAIYDPENKEMIIFGGYETKGSFNDTWAFNTEKNSWKQLNTGEAPVARHSHSAVYDSVNKQMIIFGGHSGTGFCLSDTWALDLKKNKNWKKLKPEKIQEKE